MATEGNYNLMFANPYSNYQGSLYTGSGTGSATEQKTLAVNYGSTREAGTNGYIPSTEDMEKASAFLASGGIESLAGISNAQTTKSAEGISNPFGNDKIAWTGAPVNQNGEGFNGGTVGTNLDVSLENFADYYCS